MIYRQCCFAAVGVLLSLGCIFQTVNADSPTTTSDSQTGQFQQLVTGSDLTGWKHGGNWAVEDGIISRSGKGGSLVYTKSKLPDDFELRFEWKVGEGSNSGVYYRPGQYEYQVLDNAKHRDEPIHAQVQRPCTFACPLRTMPHAQWASGTKLESFAKVQSSSTGSMASP